MDVAAWLRNLGLGRYVSAFRDNDIDAEVLLKLTAEDLISIGVISVGHRRKLLAPAAGAATTAVGTAMPRLAIASIHLLMLIRPQAALFQNSIWAAFDEPAC
jgi:hypothetical protein